MKEDAPPPRRPPKKRRALERAPDYWLAVWAADETLSDAERELVQSVRDERKAAVPDRIVGVLVDREDVTPPQLDRLREQLSGARPTVIHHPWTTRRIAGACRGAGVPVVRHQNMRDVVIASAMVIVAPRAPDDFNSRTPAWEAVQYAKHRGLPITVVLPDGSVA